MPPLRRVEPGVFQLGAVTLWKGERRAVFPAVVNMSSGLLEYAIVGRTGKVHESLLRTDVEPYCLHIAMLLLGFEGTAHPLATQGDPGTPQGDPLVIEVEWKTGGGETRRSRIEQWVVNKKDGTVLKPMHWIFTGSVIADGLFMAQAEKSIAALYHDPVALIDNPLPDGGNDEVWFVNEGEVPPVGTEVTVILEKVKGE